MAVRLTNSLFIHVPKAGGRTVTRALLDHVDGASILGDPVLDAHARPTHGKDLTFGFVRHPMTFLSSLWHHRAGKKVNAYGAAFNWQEYLRLERECGDEDYLGFVEKVAARRNLVWDYYMFYLGGHRRLRIGTMENLLDDLLAILREAGETVDEVGVRSIFKKPLGVAKPKPADAVRLVPDELKEAVLRAEPILCERFGYR